VESALCSPDTPGCLGLFDTEDNCWLGNEEGPLAYSDPELARAAATIANARLQTMARIRAMPMAQSPFWKKDEITPDLSAEHAITILDAYGRRTQVGSRRVR